MDHVPIEIIFAEALRHPGADVRAAYLAVACRDDAQLRVRVDALLNAHENAGSFLSSPAESLAATFADLPPRYAAFARDDTLGPEQPGTVVGHYKLLQQIGEGGFGIVWMADQEKPVRRRVAMKIIKAGMDTREVIARFEQERQALAMMDHPNIARVFDAGATQTGRPYFVMELVRGVKITQYCDDQSLSTAERIKLFITVCQAVQHAHQKGVIHRDLKPSNILVTINDGEAVPKVIDFGVAKATQGRLTEGTLFTQFEQMIGTPLYMSPEQAEITSLDVDTRSDIYSLGVLLYELLTGRTPLDTATMARAGMDEVRRLIREVDPPRPSARLKTLDGNELTSMAKRRHTDATKLPGALRGDIDWIVMKCLEKDRKRRYDTANGLASDLQRHLCNDVVMARPPTTAYLLSKLVRRNTVAFAAAGAIVISLVIGVAVSAWQAVRATGAEKRAVAALDELRATAPAFAEQARVLAAKEQFPEAIQKLDYALKLRPGAAEYLVEKADLLQCQLKLAEAAAVYRQALRAKPGLARAAASAKLCEDLLAAPTGVDGKLTRETLARLSLAMQQQQRPAAELMPVARLLGEEKKLVVDYWLARLKDLPVTSEKPLIKRLTVRDDGQLALDLSDTKVIDLAPLAGAPLAALNLSNSHGLADLSPLRGIDLIELDVTRTSVVDLAPLREMHTLEKLGISGCNVTGLAALGALRLKVLNFSGCPVSDLNPIRKMPLEDINLRETRVADLSPLIGMPIKSIDLTQAPVLDFSPLAKLPLEKCILQQNRITDLAVLRGKPLRELTLWGCLEARNYAAIAGISTLELLLLPSTYRDLPAEDYEAIGSLRKLPNLRQFGSEIMDHMQYATTGSKDVFWEDWDREQTFVPALRAQRVSFSLVKLPTGTYQLSIHQPLRDLSMLKGAPITKLTLFDGPFADLAPIHDLRLVSLDLFGNSVTDLTPLRGMPLRSLFLGGSKIGDLSPLKGLPLRNLYLHNCPNVTDVAALEEITTLEMLTLPVQARHIEALRKLTGLKMLAFRLADSFSLANEFPPPSSTAAEFWKEYAANDWINRLRESEFRAKILKRLEDGTYDVDLNHSGINDLTILKGAPISRLILDDTPVADLTPLADMHLKILSARNTRVSDLSFLRAPGCRSTLEELWLLNTQVVDLSPLSACASLRTLDLSEVKTAVSIEPLRGLKLKLLYLNHANFQDLSPLAGMPLETLYVHSDPARDLSPLAGMPLKRLVLEKSAGTDVEPLLRCPTLNELILPAGARNVARLRAMPNLKRISFQHQEDDWAVPNLTAEVFWKEFEWESRLNDPVLKIKNLIRLPDGTWDVDLRDAAISDLKPLSGAPISRLRLGGTTVSNLRPLRGMPLKTLLLWGTSVTDLSPLKGMPIEVLHLGSTKVSDLAVLSGMPLVELKLHGCELITDLSPLKDCKDLKDLTLPPNAKNIAFLRTRPTIERIGFQEDSNDGWRPDKTAAEFWKDYDAKKD